MKTFTWDIKSGGLLAIVVILFAEYAVFPWLSWVDETRSTIESEQIKLYKQERLITKSKVLEEQRELLTTGFDEQTRNFSVIKKNQDSAVVWLKELDSHLAHYELVINNKSPRREIEINDHFAVFVGKVNVKGKYIQVLNLLEKLENESVGNRVRQLRLTRNPATKDTVVADIEFVKVFRRS